MQGTRALVVAVVLGHDSEVREERPHRRLVAELASDLEARLEVAPRGLEVAARRSDGPGELQDASRPDLVPQRVEPRTRRLERLGRLVVVAPLAEEIRERRLGPGGSGDVLVAGGERERVPIRALRARPVPRHLAHLAQAPGDAPALGSLEQRRGALEVVDRRRVGEARLRRVSGPHEVLAFLAEVLASASSGARGGRAGARLRPPPCPRCSRRRARGDRRETRTACSRTSPPA